MTKFNFIKLFIAIIAMPLLSVAQPKMGAWENTTDPTNNNFYIDYAGGRVSIAAPASIAGPVVHTISNNGRTTTGWGGAIKDLTTPINSVDIVKADPYEGCGVLSNASAISGKVALIKRGNCEFGAKAFNAQQAGAVAVIIVNHSPGPPVGMGAGMQGASVTIPVIMVSDVDGAAIEAQIANGAKISLAEWGNGFNNDIGFLDRGLSLWHSYSIPLNQISNNSSMVYKGFDGAVIGNFGTTTSSSVKLKATLSWTPTGGSTTVVSSDSTTLGSFAPADSIITPFIDDFYTLNPTTTGRYDVQYEVIPSFADQFPGDNKASYSFYVDNRIYSKGRYDFNNNRPFSGQSFRLGSGADFTWGPLMYMEQPDYAFEQVQVILSNGSATDNSMAGIGPVTVLIWKWVDGSNGGALDSIIVASECEIVGIGDKQFVAGDTSGQVHSIAIKDAANSNLLCKTEANSWYWVSAAVPAGAFLAVDGVSNYFVRSWGRSHATANMVEPYAPLYPDNYSNFQGPAAPAGVPQHYPFESYYFLVDSIRFSQQKNGLVPAMPVQMSLFKVDVENVDVPAPFDVTVYPNPATDVLNVTLNLDKQAKSVSYSVLNAVGSTVFVETHTDVTNDKYSIATSELASGTYYLVISVDGNQALRKFSVIR